MFAIEFDTTDDEYMINEIENEDDDYSPSAPWKAPGMSISDFLPEIWNTE